MNYDFHKIEKSGRISGMRTRLSAPKMIFQRKSFTDWWSFRILRDTVCM